MVVPLFGWSAGDIVVSIQIIYRIGEAFREAGGAKEQYAETAAWLDSFAHDLERIREYVADNPTAKYTENVKQQITNIDPHYLRFEKYVRKQDTALSSTSSINVVKRAFVKVRWAIKELKGHVDDLKTAVSGPLMSINLLLSLQHQFDLEHISQRLASLPQNSSMDAVERIIRDVAMQLQRTELGLVDLQTSLNDQTTILQRLGTSLQDDISTEGRNLLQAQASMLSATLTAIRGSRHATLGNLTSLGEQLDEVDRRMADSSSGLKAMLNDQKIGIQACQMHLEYIEEAVQNICQVSNQQAAKDWRNYGLEILKTAGAVIGAVAGISNMLTLQTLKAGLETPAEEKLPKEDTIPIPPTQINLKESSREDSRIPASNTASRKDNMASRKGSTASRKDGPEFKMDSRNDRDGSELDPNSIADLVYSSGPGTSRSQMVGISTHSASETAYTITSADNLSTATEIIKDALLNVQSPQGGLSQETPPGFSLDERTKGWRWDMCPSYRLSIFTVQEYLQKKFGNWDFRLQHTQGDRYMFRIPRILTGAERDELLNCRKHA